MNLSNERANWVKRAHERYHQRILTMNNRKPKKAAPAGTRTNPVPALGQALARRKKAELVDVLVEPAGADRSDLALVTSGAFPLFSGRMLEGFPGSVHIDVGRPV